MGSLDLLLSCEDCDCLWISGGIASPGDAGIFCGPCDLKNRIARDRAHLGIWFGDSFCCPVLDNIAEFLRGSTLWLRRSSKYSLFRLLLGGKPYGKRTCFGPLLWTRNDVMDRIFHCCYGHDVGASVPRFELTWVTWYCTGHFR